MARTGRVTGNRPGILIQEGEEQNDSLGWAADVRALPDRREGSAWSLADARGASKTTCRERPIDGAAVAITVTQHHHTRGSGPASERLRSKEVLPEPLDLVHALMQDRHDADIAVG